MINISSFMQIKIGKRGEFDVYYDPNIEKKYFGVWRHNKKEVVYEDNLKALYNRIDNYREELSDYFAQILKSSGLRD